jgi:hypothetical protein
MRYERQAFEDLPPFWHRPDVIDFKRTTPSTARADANPIVLPADYLQSLEADLTGDDAIPAYAPPFTVTYQWEALHV